MTRLTQDVMDKLKTPFHPSAISWKPGAMTKDKTKPTKAAAMAYVNVRMYMDVLDQVVPGEWSNVYKSWGDNKIICELTILDETRSSTGEFDPEDAKAVTEGTSAEAQAFKRACAMFGLGRYLYRLQAQWVLVDDYKKFTKESQAELDNYYKRIYAKMMAAIKTPIAPIVEEEVAENLAPEPEPAATPEPAPAKVVSAPSAPKPAPATPVAQQAAKPTPAAAPAKAAPAPTNGNEPWSAWKNKLDMIKFAETSGMSNADANGLFKDALAHCKGYNPADSAQAQKVHAYFYEQVKEKAA